MISDDAGTPSPRSGPARRPRDERERRVSLPRVTQSWGMAPVTSPGCYKMLPGELGEDTAPLGHGRGTRPLMRGRGRAAISPLPKVTPDVEFPGPPVPPKPGSGFGGFLVTPCAVLLGLTCAFKAVARDDPSSWHSFEPGREHSWSLHFGFSGPLRGGSSSGAPRPSASLLLGKAGAGRELRFRWLMELVMPGVISWPFPRGLGPRWLSGGVRLRSSLHSSAPRWASQWTMQRETEAQRRFRQLQRQQLLHPPGWGLRARG